MSHQLLLRIKGFLGINMTPLLDSDVLRYEIGFAAEVGWKSIKIQNGEIKEGETPSDPPPFEYVAELLDNRIKEICAKVGATKPPVLFLTGKGNFREQIAKKKPYKGTRNGEKPWHYDNLTSYMIGMYGAKVIEGMEADDAICIAQTRRLSFEEDGPPETIICTRDKDLRQCPGWHFGWELGNQPQFGPMQVDTIGAIQLVKNNKEIKGWGMKFFYAQCIVGDNVDNIPGLPRKGAVFAFELLNDKNTLEDMEKAVLEAYREVYGDATYKEEFLEQAQLLYMIRKLDQEGKPVMFELSYA